MNDDKHSKDPPEKIRILIADSDADHRNALRNILSTQADIEIVALVADGERAARLAAQLQPAVAILEAGLQRMDGTSAAESIALTAASCQLIMLAPTNDAALIRQAMQYGAREFLVKPVEEDQLLQAVYRVHEFISRRQAVAPTVKSSDTAAPTQGKVFAVWGPKGGIGRTFVAVNLAVAFAVAQKQRTLLMDGCLGFCTADVALDIESKKTIFDLVVDDDADLDEELVQQVVVHHASGLDVLLAPHVEDMLSLAPVHLQRILRIMRRIYSCIVIDTRPLLDETTVAFLDLSDVILTICTPEIAALRNLRIFLDAATQLGYSIDKIQLIMNRSDMKGAIPQAEIETVCRYHVAHSLVNDHEAVANSINHGRPLITTQPQRQITKDINRLAATLVESMIQPKAGAAAQRKGGLGRIFGRRAS